MSRPRRWAGASSRSDPTTSETRADGGGLAVRMAVASVVLALLVGAAFAVLLIAISDLRTSGRLLAHSRITNTAADRLEGLVIDLETGVRGYVIARQERFLKPWKAARAAFPSRARALERLAEQPGQKQRVRSIDRGVAAYISEYSIPLVAAVRRNSPAARSIATTEEGRRRIDALRTQFDRFKSTERDLLIRRQRRDDRNAGRAVAGATVGLAGSIVLILGFGGYLVRAIIWPLRRASKLSQQIAADSLGTRMPEGSVGEIGALERSFNTMAASLERDREERRRLTEEQAALRRVATLVAQGGPPDQMFSAVTREVGLLSGADLARMERYEADGTVIGVAQWSKHDEQLAVGRRFSLEGVSIAAQVLETRGPVRVNSFADAAGPIADEARQLGIRSSVGCPIVVEGQLWGVIAASSMTDVPFPAETESQMAEFTELVATAIANAENQAELRASRARIVAASDLTRRRIERDLHDGVQQRLVSLALGLRAATSEMPSGLDEVEKELTDVASGLGGVLDDLREVSRGIHPAILGQGGIGPALRTLAQRSKIPVELDVQVEGRLPEPVEVTAYYVVSEALTNAAKHARASKVSVAVDVHGSVLRVIVRDDGVGGAVPSGGSGLLGLKDRAEAIGGRISLVSPRGGGTTLTAELPLDDETA